MHTRASQHKHIGKNNLAKNALAFWGGSDKENTYK